MYNINVDFNNVCGKIKPMHAVNNVPFLPRDVNGWDKKMQSAHIPYGRLHDTGGPFGGSRYVDIHNVFPNFDADENDPASYDFAFTDYLLARMVKCGVMPYYRLGETIENYHSIKAYNIYPPRDFEKWARICEHIIMHYNEGWADGFHYNIEYWEIWNEPDNEPIPENNPLWRGTMEEYFRLYEITSRHLKSRFPNIKIGGFGSCGFYHINNVDVSSIAHSSNRFDYFIEFFIRFLEFISEKKLPLDFFGWHSYAGLKDNIIFANFPRQYLDKYGYENCEIHLNEWNPGVANRGLLKDASNILAVMLALHDTPTDLCTYYDFRFSSSYCGAVNPVSYEPFKAFYAFYNFGQLYALKNQASCVSEAEGVYALAATNGVNHGIALANTSEADAELNLSILGADATKAKVYMTDENHDHDLIDADITKLLLPKDAIAYIEF